MVGPEMRWSKKNNMIRMKSTSISCVYSISLWDDCPSPQWLLREISITFHGSWERISILYMLQISAKCVLRTSQFQELVASWCLFYGSTSQWKQDGFTHQCRGSPPQIHKKKHGHKCNGMCVCVCVPLFIRSTHSFQLYVWTPRWWYKSNDDFFLTKTCPL